MSPQVLQILTTTNKSRSTDPSPTETAEVMEKLTSKDVEAVKLARDIAIFGYGEERKKTDVIEQRAFGLMQFAKVGLTIIAGIAGLISNSGIQNTPFRESLILLLAVAGAYLGKLFWRGAMVVRVGTTIKPLPDAHIKPDRSDVLKTQTDGAYLDALKMHVAKLVVYMEHTATWNKERIEQLQLCYINTSGFLISFFLFFILSLIHLFQADVCLTLPAHRFIGGAIFILALVADWLVQKSGLHLNDQT